MKKSNDNVYNGGGLQNITTYQAGIVQSAVHRNLQKVSDVALKEYRISKMQWMIIGSILDAGASGARITDLARLLGTTLPYLTTAINYLESRGIVEKVSNTRDGRSRLVTISADFKPKCADIEATLRQALRDSIYQHVDPKDFQTYMKVLYAMYGIR